MKSSKFPLRIVHSKSTLVNPSTISTTTTSSASVQPQDATTYYPILDDKTDVTFFPNLEEDGSSPSDKLQNNINDKEPRLLAGANIAVSA